MSICQRVIKRRGGHSRVNRTSAFILTLPQTVAVKQSNTEPQTCRPACLLPAYTLPREASVTYHCLSVRHWSRFIEGEKKKTQKKDEASHSSWVSTRFLFQSQFCSSSFGDVEDEGRWTSPWQPAPNWRLFLNLHQVKLSLLELCVCARASESSGTRLDPPPSSKLSVLHFVCTLKGLFNLFVCWEKKRKETIMCLKSLLLTTRVIKEGPTHTTGTLFYW